MEVAGGDINITDVLAVRYRTIGYMWYIELIVSVEEVGDSTTKLMRGNYDSLDDAKTAALSVFGGNTW